MAPPLCLNVTAHLDEKFGGLTTSLPHFCSALEWSGQFHAGLCAFCDQDEEIPDTSSGIRVRRFPSGRLRWRFDKRLRQELRALVAEASIVHVHGLWQEHCAVGAELSSECGVPYLVSAHGMLDRWAFERRGWKKRIYWRIAEQRHLQSAACLRALTGEEALDYRRMGLTNPIAIIPNGVEQPPDVPAELFTDLYPELREKKILLYLGRIHEKKGIYQLCCAWAKLAALHPDVHLVIAGPDSQNTLQSVRSLVAELRIGSNTTFAGMLRGPAKWAALKAAWVFVLPSFSEGFSVATLEALAVGTPVIISDKCFFPQVKDCGAGWVVTPEIPKLIEAFINCFGLTTSTRLAMSARAQELVRHNYTWRVVGQQTAQVMSWILDGRHPTSAEILL